MDYGLRRWPVFQGADRHGDMSFRPIVRAGYVNQWFDGLHFCFFYQQIGSWTGTERIAKISHGSGARTSATQASRGGRGRKEQHLLPAVPPAPSEALNLMKNVGTRTRD